MITIEKREEVAQEFFAAYRDHALDRAGQLATDTGQYRYVPLEENGIGSIKGEEDSLWVNFAGALIHAFPNLTNDVKHVTVDNEGNAIVQVIKRTRLWEFPVKADVMMWNIFSF